MPGHWQMRRTVLAFCGFDPVRVASYGPVRSASPERLQRWIEVLGWEVVINHKGTTWRGLDDATKAGVADAASAHVLALANASLIKRPIVEWDDAHGGGVTAGFDAAAWAGRA